MADKSFGVKEIELIGASGTPTIESPNNLEIKAVNVAISTDITVGGMVSLGAGTSISSPGTNVLTFGTNSTEKVRILSNGRVAIGGVTANSLLDVHGGDGISLTSSGDTFLQSRTTGTTGTNYLEFKDSGGGSGAISYHHDGDSMRFKTSGSERVRITSAGNVSIQNDSGKFTAGASDDLQIYHDGSNSYVSDTATGNLKLTSNGTAVQIEKSDGENMAIFRTDGSVDLFYDNSKKFETVSNGVLASGRVFVQSTSGGFDYNSIQHTLEYIVNGSTHSELNTGAYVPQGTKNLGSNNSRWQTLYLSNGIDFAGNSNAAGMTSEVLDDYEEGSWTPTAKMEQAGQNASIDGVNAHYVKVGSLVHIYGQLDFNGTPSGRSTSAAVEIRNLPFAHQHGYDKISHDIRVTGWETGSTYGSDITFIMRMIANASYFRVEALQAGYNGTRNASLTVQDNTSYKFSFTYQAA